ncbi:MAG TPA: hypothetical protein VFL04_07760 [Rectinemataceae bacterium]|nr:hypothetical protein [Rectinemataceae bacterium]
MAIVDELALAQRTVARKDFLGGLLRRIGLCAILFVPLVGLFSIVNPRTSLAGTATYVGYLLVLIFALSAAFDGLEYLLTRARISRPAPLGQGERICYAVSFEPEGRSFRKRHGMLLQGPEGLVFWDAQARRAQILGEGIEAFESERYYLRDPYSLRRRQMRPLIEMAAQGGKRVFDVLAPEPALASLRKESGDGR